MTILTKTIKTQKLGAQRAMINRFLVKKMSISLLFGHHDLIICCDSNEIELNPPPPLSSRTLSTTDPNNTQFKSIPNYCILFVGTPESPIDFERYKFRSNKNVLFSSALSLSLYFSHTPTGFDFVETNNHNDEEKKIICCSGLDGKWERRMRNSVRE